MLPPRVKSQVFIPQDMPAHYLRFRKGQLSFFRDTFF